MNGTNLALTGVVVMFILITSRKTIFYDNFVSTWMSHSKHSRQLGCVILNFHVTLDHFPIILDISCHFGQCHKKPCILLVNPKVRSNDYYIKLILVHCKGIRIGGVSFPTQNCIEKTLR